MSQQTSLNQFFKKSNDTKNVTHFDNHKSSVISVISPNKRPIAISPNIDNNVKRVKLSKKSDNIESEIKQNLNNFDIGFYVNRSLTDVEIGEILKKMWKPEPTFEFPNTVIFSGKDKRSKNLKFQYRWLHTFPWLAYSAKLDGAFCTFCVAFAKSGAGINSQTLGALVRKPFQNWKHAMETFKNHMTLQYHKQSVFDADNFIDIKKNVHLSIENQLDTARARQIFENRKNITPVIETIILYGKQNISLRGHRDFGKLTVDNTDINDGNFRNLLRFRARGDASLKIHLESSSTIKYTSPISQNAIIDSCNSIILNKIVDRVNEAKCFTVLVDETADIAGIEQVSICVRYIDLKCLELHEEFLQFVPTTDASGKGLSNLILDNLKKFGINTQYLPGQGYDGAAAMAGKYNGVQAYVKKEHPLALYVHCSAHSLNLAVSVSCNVSQIRNCMGTIGKLRDFFMFPKRKSILSKAIEISENNISKKSLKRNCETRWIERYHSVSDFLELFECVEEALEEICEWDNTETSNQAGAFRISILQPEFIITMVTISKVFGLGLPLSKQFQKVDIDLKLAMDLAQDTLIELEDYRKHAQKNFEDIFLAAKKIADKFNVTITIPRINKRQVHRINVQTSDPEEYFRISVFIPYLDSFISQLKSRFLNHIDILSSFHSLFDENSTKEEFKKLSEFYEKDLNGNISIIEEFQLWQRKLKKLEMKPKNSIDALKLCNSDIYPGVNKLFQILATLPISTASNERTFSSLKRIKTYLRNTISEKRLNGLAMLNIHREVEITVDEVIAELAKQSRRLEFIL